MQGGLDVPYTLKFVSPPDQTAFGEKTEKQIRYSLTVKVPVTVSLNKIHAIGASKDGSVTDSSGPIAPVVLQVQVQVVLMLMILLLVVLVMVV